ncbi:hypothetical protein CYY_002490 [Polysphondylium violaceum]|uniref:Phosphatidylinositol glycan n=1 Tax=Polysphondylium violaceum TaxID=133409 RepID=A0A8J4PZ96_9MYCE|nr:hypothetical protein CYY_002490 [Polysphondylium violaceum]
MAGKRVSIVLSFVLLFIIGIPVWWKTTTTYRSNVDFTSIKQYYGLDKEDSTSNTTTDTNKWPLFKPFFKQVGSIDHDKEVKTSTEYCLSFTLLNADPSDLIPKWDFPYLSSRYLSPFLEEISDIANFTIQSKILHYASLMKPPLVDSKTNSKYIPATLLSEYINPNEWKLDSTFNNQPTLNFIIYIPAKYQTPLYIRSEKNSNSFLIPQWGGIIIHNNNDNVNSNKDDNDKDNSNNKNNNEIVDLTSDIEDDMITFKYQLKELLGISNKKQQPQQTKKQQQKKQQQQQQLTLSQSDVELSKIEIDDAIKRYTAENLNNTLTTLSSLYSLIEGLPNMLVLDNIRDQINMAIESLDKAHQCLENSDYRCALTHSKRGLVSSESAFFDKNMLSQLYFPDEHKYAVYTPLFVPVCFPIIAGIIQEIKHYKMKRLERLQKEKEEKERQKERELSSSPSTESTKDKDD